MPNIRVCILGLGALVLGYANESAYNSVIDVFKDYEENLKQNNQTHATQNASKVAPKNSDASKNANAKNSSLTIGMRESEAIQRATMRPYKVAGKWYYPARAKLGTKFDGLASWYGPDFHAKATSNGERYNMFAHTAASKTLPMNTIVKVYNKENGKTTIVRINDRGPFVSGRIIDLSKAAANDIGMISKGTARVRIEVIGFSGVIDKKYDSKPYNRTTQTQANTPTSKGFALQVGAFKQKSGAQATQESFKKRAPAYNVFIKESQGIYRVFVGGFKREEDAQWFAKKNKLKPIVVGE